MSWDTVWSNEQYSGDWRIVVPEDLIALPDDPDEDMEDLPTVAALPPEDAAYPDLRTVGDFQAIDDLGTAVTLLLFTDKPLPLGDRQQGSADSRKATWHGNSFDNDGEGELGSYLWTLSRSLPTQDLILTARSYVAEALQPLIDQNVIRGFLVDCDLVRPVTSTDVWLVLDITVLGERDISFSFKYPVA